MTRARRVAAVIGRLLSRLARADAASELWSAFPDDAVAGRVTQVMMGMIKLDAAALEAAARGD